MLNSTTDPNTDQFNLFRNLTIKLDGKTLLSNQELSISCGTITVIMGASGIGKSVLADVVFCLRGHESGLASEGTIGDARAKGALVFQESGGLPHLTVNDNLQLVSSDEVECRKLIEQFQINPNQLGGNLSGGERRRLAVARSLLAKRRILWLDEPEAGLDLQRVHNLADMLKEQARDRNLAIIVTSHNTAFVTEIADRILFFGYDRQLTELALPSSTTAGHDGLVAELSARLAKPSVSESLPVAIHPLRQLVVNLNVFDWVLQIAESVPFLLSFLYNKQTRTTFLQALYLSAGRGVVYYPFIGAIFGAVFVLIFLFAAPPFFSPAKVISEFGAIIVLRFSPPIAAILVAACAGSTIASWVGQMSASRQLDALAVLGIRVPRQVLGPVWWGLSIAAVLNIITFALALSCVFAGYIWIQQGMVAVGEFWGSFSNKPLLLQDTHFLAALLKTVGYGMLVAGVTIGCAAATLRSPADVAAAVTRGIVWSSIVVMVVELLVLSVDYWPRLS